MRGAAAGLCAINADAGRVVYAGTGNTVIRRFRKIDTRLVSHEGVLGQNMLMPKLRRFSSSRATWSCSKPSGCVTASRRRIIQASSTFIERFGKDYDDATCITVRYSG